MSLTRSMLSEIVSRISYKNWDFLVHQKGDGFLLQAVFDGPDSETGKIETQKCRKWYISSHACVTEIVRTAYKAVEAAELHEMQERFKYKGQAIFSPHLDVRDLARRVADGEIMTDNRNPR